MSGFTNPIGTDIWGLSIGYVVSKLVALGSKIGSMFGGLLGAVIGAVGMGEIGHHSL